MEKMSNEISLSIQYSFRNCHFQVKPWRDSTNLIPVINQKIHLQWGLGVVNSIKIQGHNGNEQEHVTHSPVV